MKPLVIQRLRWALLAMLVTPVPVLLDLFITSMKEYVSKLTKSEIKLWSSNIYNFQTKLSLFDVKRRHWCVTTHIIPIFAVQSVIGVTGKAHLICWNIAHLRWEHRLCPVVDYTWTRVIYSTSVWNTTLIQPTIDIGHLLNIKTVWIYFKELNLIKTWFVHQ